MNPRTRPRRTDRRWRNCIVRSSPGKGAVRCGDGDPTCIFGVQHSDRIGANNRRLAGNLAHDEAGALDEARGRGCRYDCRAHQFGALPDALARRAAEGGGGAIDVADNTVLEHVVAVADMASLGVRGGRSQVDLVEIFKPADAGVVLRADRFERLSRVEIRHSFRRPEAAIRATAGEPSGYGPFPTHGQA